MNIHLEIELPDEIVAYYRAEVPEGGEVNAYLAHLSRELLLSLYASEQKGAPPDTQAGEKAPYGGSDKA